MRIVWTWKPITLSLVFVLFICSCSGIKYQHDLSKKESLPIIYNALEHGGGHDKVAAIHALGQYHADVPNIKELLVNNIFLS